MTIDIFWELTNRNDRDKNNSYFLMAEIKRVEGLN